MQKKCLSLALAFVMTFSLLCCQAKSEPSAQPSGDQEQPSSASSQPSDGQRQSFTASAQGFGGTVSVSIEVQDGKLESVSVTGDQETPQFGGAAIEQYNNELLSTYIGNDLQMLYDQGIDEVSGASSRRGRRRCQSDRQSPPRRCSRRGTGTPSRSGSSAARSSASRGRCCNDGWRSPCRPW